MVAWGMEQSIFNPRLTRDMLLRVRKEPYLKVTLIVNGQALGSGIFDDNDRTFFHEQRISEDFPVPITNL